MGEISSAGIVFNWVGLEKCYADFYKKFPNVHDATKTNKGISIHAASLQCFASAGIWNVPQCAWADASQ